MNNDKSPNNYRIPPVPVEEDTFPPIRLELVEAVEAEYPNVMCDFRASDRDIGFHAGQISVAIFLREQFNKQSEKN